MRSLRLDNGTVKSFERTEEGFLRLFANISRVGELIYYTDDGQKIIEVVSEEELFDEESLNSASMKPITLLHPPEPVSPENSQQYMVGMNTHRLIRDGDFLQIVATVTRQDAIDAIEGGMREFSAGYFVEPVLREDGRFDQTNRRYNHYAIVPQGRAGSLVRALLPDRLDSVSVAGQDREQLRQILMPQAKQRRKDRRRMVNIPIGNRVYTIDDGDDATKLADAVATLLETGETVQLEKSDLETKRAALEAQLAQATADLETSKSALEASKGELEGTKTKLDAAEKLRTDADTIAAEVQARLDVWAQVLPAFRKDSVDFTPDYAKPVEQVKREYLQLVSPDLKLDGKSPDFINGLWEAVKPAASHTDTLLNAVTTATKTRSDAGDVAAKRAQAREERIKANGLSLMK